MSETSAAGRAPVGDETLVVIGAGIGGLCAALCLAPTGRRIIVLERDGPPPGEEHPNKWLGKPRNLAAVVGYWVRGRKRNAAAYAPKPGPGRREMLAALSVDAQADIEQVKQAA